MAPPEQQRGVALIVALLVVSLATVLAVSLVNHLYYDIRRTENILRLDQALLYNSNAVEFAMIMLKLDREAKNEYDSVQDLQLFNDQAAMFPVDGGSVSAYLTDLQSCFNINNLSKSNPQLTTARTQYQTLLSNAGIDNVLRITLTDSLIDWLDVDDITEPQGAEFDYYIGLQKPYRTANALMTSPSELRLVKGYTDKVIRQIADVTCVLPKVNTTININTASAIMLESIKDLKGLSDQIIQYRGGMVEKTSNQTNNSANNSLNVNGDAAPPVDEGTPFEKLDDFKKYVKETLKVKTFDSKGIQTYSEYFLLQSNAQLGAGNVKLLSMIYRDQSNAQTKIIRQTSGAL
jgi:general secretion pathway protein K